MKKYVAPSMEELKLVAQDHITAGSVDGKGYVDANSPTPPPKS